MNDPLVPERLDLLADATVALLDAAEAEGWSPSTADDALGLTDLLCVALAAHGGPLEQALGHVRAHLAAAQRAIRDDLPPAPRRGSAAARIEAETGVGRFRAWRDARVHQRPTPPRVPYWER
ncbi:hypothetical protein ABZX72_35580 [Streptomyces cyaneofuscatus]|uniref:hypothetical protein n=1 Tax=Streptomyces cyaneofuscatus TaxID=66883 RepID=UPI0033AC3D75